MPRRRYIDRVTPVDAAELNHLEAQGLHVFADTAARDAAYPDTDPPLDGEQCIVGSGNDRTRYTWNAQAVPPAWIAEASSGQGHSSGGASTEQINAAVDAHDSNPQAHPALRSRIEALEDGSSAGAAVQRVLVGSRAPSAATVGKLVIEDDGRVFSTTQIDHKGTPNTFTPADYNGGASYLGVLDTTPDPNLYNDGTWFVHAFTHRPRTIVLRTVGPVPTKGWIDVAWSSVGGGLTYIGAFPRGDVANVAPHATANGQVYLDVDDAVLRQVTAFVAGQHAQPTEYPRHQLALSQDLADLDTDLSVAQQIALASGVIEPNAIAYPFDGTTAQKRAAIRREWRIWFPMVGLIGQDLWITAEMHGTLLELLTTSGPIPDNPVYARQPARRQLQRNANVPHSVERIIARVPSGGAGALDTVPTDAIISAIGVNATTPDTGRPGAQSVDIQVNFYDAAAGGNWLGEAEYTISLIDQAASSSSAPAASSAPVTIGPAVPALGGQRLNFRSYTITQDLVPNGRYQFVMGRGTAISRSIEFYGSDILDRGAIPNAAAHRYSTRGTANVFSVAIASPGTSATRLIMVGRTNVSRVLAITTNEADGQILRLERVS